MGYAWRLSGLGVVLASVSVSLPAAPAAEPPAPRPQYVIISFDGAQPLEQWRRSRTLARETGARFTYFLSCVYLLAGDERHRYQGPRTEPGRSNVGFAVSADDVAGRLREIWTARMEGHEIASHGCGHFDGKDWSKADWVEEFGSFRNILREAWEINGVPFEPAGWRDFAAGEVTGFRAPYLSTAAPLYAALEAAGYGYDASAVSRGPAEPFLEDGVMRFALPTVPEGPAGRHIIAMDYNLYVRHSGGLERPSEAEAFAERTYRAFIDAFDRQYAGPRIPLQLGFHFTLMNGGAYWDALERFAHTVCPRPAVRCVDYSTYLEETSPPTASVDG